MIELVREVRGYKCSGWECFAPPMDRYINNEFFYIFLLDFYPKSIVFLLFFLRFYRKSAFLLVFRVKSIVFAKMYEERINKFVVFLIILPCPR